MADLIVAASVAGCFVMGAALIVCVDLKAVSREVRRLGERLDQGNCYGSERGDGDAGYFD